MSDYLWEAPGRAVDIVKSLDLSEMEIDSLLWKNGAELMRIEN